MLYRKVMKGKKTTYEPVEPEPETAVTFTEGQCLTAAGALGVTLMLVFERNIPPHKKVARKIKAVEEAITDLYRGAGEPIDRDIADQIFKCWDKTMLELTA